MQTLCRVLAVWLGIRAGLGAVQPHPTVPAEGARTAQRYRSSPRHHPATASGIDSNAHQHAADHDSGLPPGFGNRPHSTQNPHMPTTHATSRTHRTTHPRKTADNTIIRAHAEGNAS